MSETCSVSWQRQIELFQMLFKSPKGKIGLLNLSLEFSPSVGHTYPWRGHIFQEKHQSLGSKLSFGKMVFWSLVFSHCIALSKLIPTHANQCKASLFSKCALPWACSFLFKQDLASHFLMMIRGLKGYCSSTIVACNTFWINKGFGGRSMV